MLVMAEDRPTFALDSDAGAALALLRAVGEGMCLTHMDGQVVWCNPAFARLDEGLRQRIAAGCKRQGALMMKTGGAAPHATPAPGSLASPAPHPTNHRPTFDAVSSDDTTTYQILISPVSVTDSSGQAGPLTHLAAVVIDVTAQRRREARMHAIDAAGAELVRLDVEQIKKMNPAERLGVLEEKVIRFAHELLHFDHFAIRLVEKDTDKLEPVIWCGLPAPALAVELYARSEGNGISGYVAATGRSYLCADTTLDARYVIGVESARSSLTVPLRLNDKVIGVFNVESTQAGFFSEEDRQFAEMFATYIALALHILNLLVAERSTTGQAVTGTMEGELSEPLTDLTQVAAKLKESLAPGVGASPDGGVPSAAGRPGGAAPAGEQKVLKIIEKILEDVEAIKKRVKNVGAGAATVLGADDAVLRAARTIDPILRGKRVLVADDDQRIRQLVSEVLRARGAEVVVCEDGASAITAINRLASGVSAGGGGGAMPGQERSSGSGAGGVGGGASGSFRTLDLLVSDIRLPDKTGYEIFTAARAVLPQVPVILMTGFGYDPHHSIVRASQAGLSAVLFKPFQAERLIEEAHKALGAGR